MVEGQLPLYDNHKPAGRGDDYFNLTRQPLFPFRFGLSYTSFECSGLIIDAPTINPSGSVRVRCTIKNTGARTGDEVVQVCVDDIPKSIARPVMQPGGFTRIDFKPGESRAASFTIGREQLQMLDRDMKWIVELWVFRVMVGALSRDI